MCGIYLSNGLHRGTWAEQGVIAMEAGPMQLWLIPGKVYERTSQSAYLKAARTTQVTSSYSCVLAGRALGRNSPATGHTLSHARSDWTHIKHSGPCVSPHMALGPQPAAAQESFHSSGQEHGTSFDA